MKDLLTFNPGRGYTPDDFQFSTHWVLRIRDE